MQNTSAFYSESTLVLRKYYNLMLQHYEDIQTQLNHKTQPVPTAL